MEYKLLKQIEPNLQQIFMSNPTIPMLTGYPSRDYVNPGI